MHIVHTLGVEVGINARMITLDLLLLLELNTGFSNNLNKCWYIKGSGKRDYIMVRYDNKFVLLIGTTCKLDCNHKNLLLIVVFESCVKISNVLAFQNLLDVKFDCFCSFL